MRDPISQHPVHLNLMRIRFYPNALLSISHRISGAVLALCLMVGLILANAVLLGGLNTSYITQTIVGKLFILLTLSSLFFHWLSGLRHLIIDWWPAANHQVPQAWFSGWAVSLLFIFWALGSLLLALAMFFGGRG